MFRSDLDRTHSYHRPLPLQRQADCEEYRNPDSKLSLRQPANGKWNQVRARSSPALLPGGLRCIRSCRTGSDEVCSPNGGDPGAFRGIIARSIRAVRAIVARGGEVALTLCSELFKYRVRDCGIAWNPHPRDSDLF